MPIKEWYLNITELPAIPQASLDYIESLKPHEAKNWDLTDQPMAAYKKLLIDELIKIQKNRCAYCGLSLDRNLVDREHFVHKAQIRGKPEFMFHPANLFAACGFCNRRLKGQKNTLSNYNQDYMRCEFLITHPYIDNPSRDIKFIADSDGDYILVKSLTLKGNRTIEFFELDEPDITARRAGYIAEVNKKASMTASDYADLKTISHYKPE